jgi:polyhydroxybutyrate depolymerase
VGRRIGNILAVSKAGASICAIALAVGAALAALPSAGASGAGGGPCAQAPAAGGDSPITLTSGGHQRTAVLYTPPGAQQGQALPLVIALHGALQSAAFFEPYTGFSQIGAAEGFAVVYPNALGGYWTINDHDPTAPDDVQFISQLLDVVEAQDCIDPTRIYATGVSNGGGMTARLGCELSSRIAAIAPVAGGYGSLPPCEPTQPVSVLEVHGTDDGVVPYANAPGAIVPYVDAWARRDGCRGAYVVRRVAPQVLGYTWSRCADGAAVSHLEVFGGAHQIPGALPPDVGPNSSFSAPWAIWEFFSRHRLA